MSHSSHTLRILTAGAVDSGKSTLLGHLLLKCGQIPEDQWQQLLSRHQPGTPLPFANLFDGLEAEQEQEITIDVAYRYFQYNRRSFRIADCPGHQQYTRNMVTGASQSDVAILVLDPSQGLQDQTRQHMAILDWMQVHQWIACVNKMDQFTDGHPYETLREDLLAYAQKLNPQIEVCAIPVSALTGEGLLSPGFGSQNSLIQVLLSQKIPHSGTALRLPVQGIIRHQNYRGYSGQVASGELKPGQEVTVWPGGVRTRVASIHLGPEELKVAKKGQAVSVSLEPPIDASRGYLITDSPVQESCHWQAKLCWLMPTAWKKGQHFILKHSTQAHSARVTCLESKLNLSTLTHEPASEIKMNDLVRVKLQTHSPIWAEDHRLNYVMGQFILIDPFTHQTMAAGLLESPLQTEHHALDGAKVYWFTGLSGAGKSTLADAWCHHLKAQGRQVVRLDGDLMRSNINSDLGFSAADRKENLRRAGAVAQLLYTQGFDVVCSFISPYRQDRAQIRQGFSETDFIEVFVDCPLEVCQERDPKGLYAKVARGELQNFTGIDAPYEAPEHAELVLNTAELSLQDCLSLLADRDRPCP